MVFYHKKHAESGKLSGYAFRARFANSPEKQATRVVLTTVGFRSGWMISPLNG